MRLVQGSVVLLHVILLVHKDLLPLLLRRKIVWLIEIRAALHATISVQSSDWICNGGTLQSHSYIAIMSLAWSRFGASTSK
jgi:hypothetical protein